MGAVMTPKESFSAGFARGNFGNAHESQDWDSWYAEQCDKIPADAERQAYEEGMMLGFFSSYELHEIDDEFAAEWVATLRAKYGVDL